MIHFIERDQILHVMYEKSIEQVPSSILEICNRYEGAIQGRMGCNFPMSFVRNHLPQHTLLRTYPTTVYVILYKKGDRLTKLHELQHARYHMDAAFRDQVQLLWKSIHPNSQAKILMLLRKMGYPEHVLLDEFQAYYYTEPTLFGKVQHTTLRWGD